MATNSPLIANDVAPNVMSPLTVPSTLWRAVIWRRNSSTSASEVGDGVGVGAGVAVGLGVGACVGVGAAVGVAVGSGVGAAPPQAASRSTRTTAVIGR